MFNLTRSVSLLYVQKIKKNGIKCHFSNKKVLAYFLKDLEKENYNIHTQKNRLVKLTNI